MQLRYFTKSIAVCIIIIIGIIIAYNFQLLNPIERLLSYVFIPAQTVTYNIINNISPLYYDDTQIIIKDNTSLKQQLSTLTAENEELFNKLEQYQEYENQLIFAKDNNYNTIPAKIISRIGQNNTLDSLTINQGKSAGIKVGYAVIYENGALIGEIYRVSESYSEVALLTGSLIKLQAVVQNTDRTAGLISGAFGTGLTMDYILKDKQVNIGDIIATNDQNDNIPAGLLIGTVQKITESSSDSLKSALIAPIIQYNDNSIVCVIMPK